MSSTENYSVLIVGGGSAGISVAARLRRQLPQSTRIGVIDPSDKHFYQPLWTLVGAGLATKNSTMRRERDVVPTGVNWIQAAVTELRPDQNRVVTSEGHSLTYEYLVVASGLRLNWQQIPGLKETLGRNGVCSNYAFDTVDGTWEAIRNFKGGNAIFTNPSGAVKCGGAPQKIMYLADDRFRQAGIRNKSRIIYFSALPNIFAVEKYRRTLEQVIDRKEIECRFRHELIEVQGENKLAVFKNLDTQEVVTLPFDLLHVTPPMGPHSFVSASPLADKDGWVDVGKSTLRHPKYVNVFGTGDCSNLPTSKTAAAIRKQAPVLIDNLLSSLRGKELTAKYDGYTPCPLITGIGKLVLAEFDYNKEPRETFPFDQSKERWSMWILKRYILPPLYWYGMLKGRF